MYSPAARSDAQAIAERLEAGLVSIGDASMSSFVMDFEWEGFRLSGLGRARDRASSGIARYLRVKAIVTNRGPARRSHGCARRMIFV
jgi:acyl-CoA reductase-like NAD-dependent aldehyde dehydrogenase